MLSCTKCSTELVRKNQHVGPPAGRRSVLNLGHYWQVDGPSGKQELPARISKVRDPATLNHCTGSYGALECRWEPATVLHRPPPYRQATVATQFRTEMRDRAQLSKWVPGNMFRGNAECTLGAVHVYHARFCTVRLRLRLCLSTVRDFRLFLPTRRV